jgi:hypothetical protein
MDCTPTQTVLAWLAGVNAIDPDAALARTAPDVAIVGPRGTNRGRETLRTWLANAGATFETRAVYAGGDAVVVAQRGVWRDGASGKIVGEAEVATRFRVTEGLVSEIQRYDDLTVALRDAGLSRTEG